MLQTSIGLCCYCFYHLLAILEYSFNSFCGTLFSFFSVSFLFSLCSFYHNVPESRARAHNFAVSLLLKILPQNTQSMRYFFILYFVSLFFHFSCHWKNKYVYNLATTIRTNTSTTQKKNEKRSYDQIAPDASRSTSSPSFVACSCSCSFFTKTAKKKSSRL